MSESANQNYQLWLDVLSQVRRIPSCRDGRRLSQKDNDTVSEVILLTAMIVSDMCVSSESRSFRNLKQWCLQIKALDVKDLDKMIKEFLLLLRVTERTTLSAFKQQSSYPSYFGTFWAPLKDYLEVFLRTCSPYAFRYLNQFLSFMGRTTLHDDSLKEEALSSYYKMEEFLGNAEYNPVLLNEMNIIMREWLQDFKIRELKPYHGPGGVAEKGRCTKYAKFQLLGSDARLRYLLKYTDLEKVFPRNTEDKTFSRCSKVQFVPKSISSMRTICMEPATLMYFQEACWSEMDRYISAHPFLSSILDLHDQDRNRALSRLGSICDSYATIDLSSASDTVSWVLVKSVFSHTDYYKACLLTRSESVDLPDGNRIQQKKFAPMGSALCFPTECLVFACICETVARRRGHRNNPSLYSVYGDDIVVHRSIAREVHDMLTELNFIVNSSKSYLHGSFKESCGGEYYSSIDVTPVRIPRNFVGGKITKSETGSIPLLIELCNEMQLRKLRQSRAFLIRKLLDLPQRLQPLFGEDGGMLRSEQPTNFHLETYWDTPYQHYFVHTGRIVTSRSRRRHDDEISLFMWYQQAERRCDPIPSHIGLDGKVVRKKNRPRTIPGLLGPDDVISVESSTPQVSLRVGSYPVTGSDLPVV